MKAQPKLLTVLYEMATGRRAFGEDTTALIFHALLADTPPPPRSSAVPADSANSVKAL